MQVETKQLQTRMIAEIIKKEKFENIPKFNCPRCKIGFFIPLSNEIKEVEDGISKEANASDTQYYSGKFILTMNCGNPDCEETATIIGKTDLEYKGLYDGGFDEFGQEIPPHEMYSTNYKIQLINPPINLIEIPINVSEKLRKTLKESFEIFWLDKKSCGNKIRNSIEILLDDLSVKRTVINKKRKRQKLRLHQRIEIYGRENSSLAQKLLAIKWIGNDSSHSRTAISDENIINAYKILEFGLEKIFNNTEKEINKLTNKINNKKR